MAHSSRVVSQLVIDNLRNRRDHAKKVVVQSGNYETRLKAEGRAKAYEHALKLLSASPKVRPSL